MSAEYQLVLKSPQGARWGVIDDFISISYARAVNTVGTAVVDLPPGYDPRMFPRDARLEIHRSVANGPLALEMQTFWLLRKWERQLQPDGSWLMSVTFADLLDLLTRRLVAYTRDTPYADKLIINGNEESPQNLMKAFVRENMGTLAINTDRIMTELVIEPDIDAKGNEEKQASYRSVYDTCRELAELSTENGTDLFFDIEGDVLGNITFRTYNNYRRMDRTESTNLAPAIFSPEFGNLVNVTISQDFSEEATAIYVGGEGMGAGRAIELVEDTDRISLSPFGRIEVFHDARDFCELSLLQKEGKTRLQQLTPRKRLDALTLDTEVTLYGRNYHYGDLVTAHADGSVFDCHVAAVNIEYSDGQEDITVKLEGQEVL